MLTAEYQLSRSTYGFLPIHFVSLSVNVLICILAPFPVGEIEKREKFFFIFLQNPTARHQASLLGYGIDNAWLTWPCGPYGSITGVGRGNLAFLVIRPLPFSIMCNIENNSYHYCLFCSIFCKKGALYFLILVN